MGRRVGWGMREGGWEGSLVGIVVGWMECRGIVRSTVVCTYIPNEGLDVKTRTHLCIYWIFSKSLNSNTCVHQ